MYMYILWHIKGYCPMYDSKGQVIQMDISTDCNSSSNRGYYNSSDLFYCEYNQNLSALINFCILNLFVLFLIFFILG